MHSLAKHVWEFSQTSCGQPNNQIYGNMQERGSLPLGVLLLEYLRPFHQASCAWWWQTATSHGCVGRGEHADSQVDSGATLLLAKSRSVRVALGFGTVPPRVPGPTANSSLQTGHSGTLGCVWRSRQSREEEDGMAWRHVYPPKKVVVVPPDPGAIVLCAFLEHV